MAVRVVSARQWAEWIIPRIAKKKYKIEDEAKIDQVIDTYVWYLELIGVDQVTLNNRSFRIAKRNKESVKGLSNTASGTGCVSVEEQTEQVFRRFERGGK